MNTNEQKGSARHREIEDFGAKIGGAKKDRNYFSRNLLTEEEYNALLNANPNNQGAIYDMVRKDYIFPNFYNSKTMNASDLREHSFDYLFELANRGLTIEDLSKQEVIDGVPYVVKENERISLENLPEDKGGMTIEAIYMTWKVRNVLYNTPFLNDTLMSKLSDSEKRRYFENYIYHVSEVRDGLMNCKNANDVREFVEQDTAKDIVYYGGIDTNRNVIYVTMNDDRQNYVLNSTITVQIYPETAAILSKMMKEYSKEFLLNKEIHTVEQLKTTILHKYTKRKNFRKQAFENDLAIQCTIMNIPKDDHSRVISQIMHFVANDTYSSLLVKIANNEFEDVPFDTHDLSHINSCRKITESGRLANFDLSDGIFATAEYKKFQWDVMYDEERKMYNGVIDQYGGRGNLYPVDIKVSVKPSMGIPEGDIDPEVEADNVPEYIIEVGFKRDNVNSKNNLPVYVQFDKDNFNNFFDTNKISYEDCIDIFKDEIDTTEELKSGKSMVIYEFAKNNTSIVAEKGSYLAIRAYGNETGANTAKNVHFNRVISTNVKSEEEARNLIYADGDRYINEVAEMRHWNKVNKTQKVEVQRINLTDCRRWGIEYRNGQEVNGQVHIMSEFNIKAGQFGKSVPDKERQEQLDWTFDSLKDMALALDVDDKSMGLFRGIKGERKEYDTKNLKDFLEGVESENVKDYMEILNYQGLSLAWGARGGGTALAHYERDYNIINSTRFKGAGCLAHEWGHALDNYLAYALKSPTSMLSENLRADNNPMLNVMKAIKFDDSGKPTKFYEEAKEYDKGRSRGYWSSDVELFARAFACYVEYKLDKFTKDDKPFKNDYLTGHSSEAGIHDPKEMERVAAAMDDMFTYLKEKDIMKKRDPDLAKKPFKVVETHIHFERFSKDDTPERNAVKDEKETIVNETETVEAVTAEVSSNVPINFDETNNPYTVYDDVPSDEETVKDDLTNDDVFYYDMNEALKKVDKNLICYGNTLVGCLEDIERVNDRVMVISKNAFSIFNNSDSNAKHLERLVLNDNIEYISKGILDNVEGVTLVMSEYNDVGMNFVRESHGMVNAEIYDRNNELVMEIIEGKPINYREEAVIKKSAVGRDN